MPEAIRVIDISSSAGRPSLDWFRKIQREPHNVRAIIIAAWGGGPVSNYHANASYAAQAGLPHACYSWPPKGAVEGAVDYCLRDSLRPAFFVLDVEAYEDVDAKIRREQVDAVKAAGLAPWCYSSAYQWRLVMGPGGGFSDIPLWTANYGSHESADARWPDPAPTPPWSAPYGGWGVARAWQCSGTTTLESVPADLSLFDAAVFAPKEEDVMSQPIWATWKERPATTGYKSYLLFATVQGLRKYWVKSIEEEKALRDAGLIGAQPVGLSLAELKLYAGTPEPAEP